MEIIIFFLITFMSGAIGILAPCTFPLLPAFLAHMGLSEKGKLRKNSIAFALGVSITFTTLGLLAGLFGMFIQQYRIYLSVTSATIIIIFGCVVLFGTRPKEIRTKGRTSIKKSFGLGVLFSVAWSGCIGPVVAVILLIAINLQHILLGGALLFIYSIGVLFPLLILATIVDRLPKNSKFWKIIHGKLFTVKLFGKEYYFHSTNIIAALLFIALGLFLLANIFWGVKINIENGMTYEIQGKLLNFINTTIIG